MMWFSPNRQFLLLSFHLILLIRDGWKSQKGLVCCLKWCLRATAGQNGCQPVGPELQLDCRASGAVLWAPLATILERPAALYTWVESRDIVCAAAFAHLAGPLTSTDNFLVGGVRGTHIHKISLFLPPYKPAPVIPHSRNTSALSFVGRGCGSGVSTVELPRPKPHPPCPWAPPGMAQLN